MSFKRAFYILAAFFLLTISMSTAGAERQKEEQITAEAAASQTCPKCQNSMAAGYVLDVRPIGSSGGGYDPEPAEWVDGPLKNGWFAGLKIKERHRIIAYRCTSCGFVEMYAK